MSDNAFPHIAPAGITAHRIGHAGAGQFPIQNLQFVDNFSKIVGGTR